MQQVFARSSALRDYLDGPAIHDQGLVNTDPRFIAVPDLGINMIPTDVRGLTFNRSPQQVHSKSFPSLAKYVWPVMLMNDPQQSSPLSISS